MQRQASLRPSPVGRAHHPGIARADEVDEPQHKNEHKN